VSYHQGFPSAAYNSRYIIIYKILASWPNSQCLTLVFKTPAKGRGAKNPAICQNTSKHETEKTTKPKQ